MKEDALRSSLSLLIANAVTGLSEGIVEMHTVGTCSWHFSYNNFLIRPQCVKISINCKTQPQIRMYFIEQTRTINTYYNYT